MQDTVSLELEIKKNYEKDFMLRQLQESYDEIKNQAEAIECCIDNRQAQMRKMMSEMQQNIRAMTERLNTRKSEMEHLSQMICDRKKQLEEQTKQQVEKMNASKKNNEKQEEKPEGISPFPSLFEIPGKYFGMIPIPMDMIPIEALSHFEKSDIPDSEMMATFLKNLFKQVAPEKTEMKKQTTAADLSNLNQTDDEEKNKAKELEERRLYEALKQKFEQ